MFVAPWLSLMACQSNVAEGLRVMEYNIEYGGDVVNFSTIVDGAVAANADVIALEEAWASTERLADALGWSYWDHRTDVLSRFPVFSPPGADGLYSFVEVVPEHVIAVANVHLPSDPYGPYAVRDGASAEEVLALEQQVRLPYIAPYLETLPPLANAAIPVYLTGDFNTPSHLDWTEQAVGERPQILYPLAWPVTVAVEEAGFVDSYRAVHPDPVQQPGLTWWAGRPVVDGYPDHNDPEDRIDLLFSMGPTEALASEVVGEDTKGVDIHLPVWGTDHRAVVSTFEVTPAPMPVLVTVLDRLVVVGQPLEVRYHAGEEGASVIVVAPGEFEALDTIVVDGVDGYLSLPTDALALGAYEVVLVDAGGVEQSRYPFWVQATEDSALLTTDKVTYAPGESIRPLGEHTWQSLGLDWHLRVAGGPLLRLFPRLRVHPVRGGRERGDRPKRTGHHVAPSRR